YKCPTAEVLTPPSTIHSAKQYSATILVAHGWSKRVLPGSLGQVSDSALPLYRVRSANSPDESFTLRVIS
ncbi:hypothetical protein, partial [Pseudomonas coronafaciens]|uniref:hypothetical protein n=1 Tax=Pseudomonas coronafaciens TaxID=53409 RepID=UPI001C80D9DA